MMIMQSKQLEWKKRREKAANEIKRETEIIEGKRFARPFFFQRILWLLFFCVAFFLSLRPDDDMRSSLSLAFVFSPVFFAIYKSSSVSVCLMASAGQCEYGCSWVILYEYDQKAKSLRSDNGKLPLAGNHNYYNRSSYRSTQQHGNAIRPVDDTIQVILKALID